ADLGIAVAGALTAALIKDEGLPFVVGLAIVVTALGRRRLWADARGLLPAAVPAAFVLGWRLFVIANGYKSAMVQAASSNLNPADLAAKAIHISNFALHLVDVIRVDYGWVVLAGLVALELALVGRNLAVTALMALMILQALSYMVVYMLAPGDVDFWLNTSADRLTVQLLPLVLIALLGAVAPIARRIGVAEAVESDINNVHG
ncbi:MAG: hypothetical protein M3O87_04875, partial [Candidatus Dormibacteraeota bacterium]|nr:hypothetical protein [Candidatus Dormibacteraeota bacterium]